MINTKCVNCGLVNFDSAKACRRCNGSLENIQGLGSSQQVSFIETKSKVQSAQSLILMIGFGFSLALSIYFTMQAETPTAMAITFLVIIGLGFLSSWFISSVIERKIAGDSIKKAGLDTKEKASVMAISLVAASIIFKSEYGYIISPLIILVFNGAVFLYDKKAKNIS